MYSEVKMLWPGMKQKALTFSYDDSVMQDIRLLSLFRKYGMKGTFNVNTGTLGQTGTLVREGVEVPCDKVSAEDLAEVYSGFEVAVHTITHPDLRQVPDLEVMRQVLEDRATLEALVGYVVRGMAYPCGGVNSHVKELLRGCGIVYARGAGNETGDFSLPGDALEWGCSCHHWYLEPLIDRFIQDTSDKAIVLSVWGHGYEFDVRSDWAIFENQLQRLSGLEDTWYCTNIEMFDYVEAFQRIRLSTDGTILYNPSSLPLCLSYDKGCLELAPGETIRLGKISTQM